MPGRGSVMSILYLGGTIIIQEKFDAEAFLQTVAEEENHLTMLVPTFVRAPLRCHDIGNTEPRRCVISGSPADISGVSWRAKRQNVVRRSLRGLCVHRLRPDHSIGPEDWDSHGDTVGKPIWCVLVRTMGDEGGLLAEGAEGEICVRTPLAIQGYYQNPEATEEFFEAAGVTPGTLVLLTSKGTCTSPAAKKT